MTGTGAFVDFPAPTTNGPRGITVGPDGNLYVLETSNSSILRYDGATGAITMCALIACSNPPQKGQR